MNGAKLQTASHPRVATPSSATFGSVLGGPVAALVHDAYGSWMPVFVIIIAMNFATALLAGLALKPMRRQWLGRISAPGTAAARAIPARS
jgi:hypothetical protein